MISVESALEGPEGHGLGKELAVMAGPVQVVSTMGRWKERWKDGGLA